MEHRAVFTADEYALWRLETRTAAVPLGIKCSAVKKHLTKSHLTLNLRKKKITFNFKGGQSRKITST